MRACKCCAEYGQVLFSFARSILNPLFQRFAVKIETTCAQPLMLVGFLRTSPCCRITWHASVSPTVSMCDPRITSGLPLTSPVFQETHRVRWHDGMKVRDVELSFRFAIQLPSDSPYIFLLCTYCLLKYSWTSILRNPHFTNFPNGPIRNLFLLLSRHYQVSD